MNQELYIKLQNVLQDFQKTMNDSANFYSLYKFAKQYQLKLSFRDFCRHVKNLGVRSMVVREGDCVKRVLIYDKHEDKYVKGLFPLVGVCSGCNGTGLVEIKL